MINTHYLIIYTEELGIETWFFSSEVECEQQLLTEVQNMTSNISDEIGAVYDPVFISDWLGNNDFRFVWTIGKVKIQK